MTRTHTVEILRPIEKQVLHNYKLDTMKEKLSFFDEPNLMQRNKFQKNLKMHYQEMFYEMKTNPIVPLKCLYGLWGFSCFGNFM